MHIYFSSQRVAHLPALFPEKRPASVTQPPRFGIKTNPLAKHINYMYPHGANDVTMTRLCDETVANRFNSVSVRPGSVALARTKLNGRNAARGNRARVSALIGFPQQQLSREDAMRRLGNIPTETKLQQAQIALDAGADALEVLISTRQLAQEYTHYSKNTGIFKELQAIKAKAGKKPVKAIIENQIVNEPQLRAFIEIAAEAGVDVIKTSSTMIRNTHNITPDRIRFIAGELERLGKSDDISIEASGSIDTAHHAWILIEAGAKAIGTRKGVDLMTNPDAPDDDEDIEALWTKLTIDIGGEG